MEQQGSWAPAPAERLLELDCGGGKGLPPLVVPAGILHTPALDLVSPSAWAYELLQLPNAALRYELRDALYLAWMLEQRGPYLTEVDLRELHAWLNEFYALLRAYFKVHLALVFDALAPHVGDEQLPVPLRAAARSQCESAVLRATTNMLSAHGRVTSGALSADHAVLQIEQQLMTVCALVVRTCEAQNRVLAPSLAAALSAEEGSALEARIMTTLLEPGLPQANAAALISRGRWSTFEERSLNAWRKQVIKSKYTRYLDKALYWLQRTHIARVAAVNRRIRVFFTADVRLPASAQIEVRDKAARKAALTQLEEFNASLREQPSNGFPRRLSLTRSPSRR